MTDYTDLKRRLYVLTGAAREPNIVADPLEDAAYKALAAIAALEAERDALREELSLIAVMGYGSNDPQHEAIARLAVQRARAALTAS